MTWTNYYPELAEVFASPMTRWKCESISTEFGAAQPVVVLGVNGELICNAGDTLVHSTDGGRKWNELCKVPVDQSVPQGRKLMAVNHDGVGVTAKGTLLFQYTLQSNDGRPYEGFKDETYSAECYIVRSTDQGKTWDPPAKLDPSPFNCVGTDRARFARLPGGVIAIPLATWTQARPEKPQPKSKWYFEVYVYASTDDGRSWNSHSTLGMHTCEADLLSLSSGRFLAAVRYQRTKLPADPPGLASPIDMSTEVGGHSVYKQTAITASDDGGHTWSEPRLLTGWLQQTACLSQLSDGTVLLPFGHKTEVQGKRFGQRFMVSYDEGETWSQSVYELHQGGLYANSVVLADDTIVTVHDGRNTSHQGLSVLRWHAPSRSSVSQRGFFSPRVVEMQK